VWKKALFCLVIWYLWAAIWNSERGLLPLGFGSTVWWFALSWCIATFGFALWLSLWFVRNWYLEFIFDICEPLVLWFVFVRESYLDVLIFGFVRVSLHQFVLSQIWYSKICSFSPVDVARGCRLLLNHVKSWCFLCLFSFGLIFFVPIVTLKMFHKSKIFSQSILVIWASATLQHLVHACFNIY